MYVYYKWKNLEKYKIIIIQLVTLEIRNDKFNRILKSGINGHGYYCVILCKN
jgi:hypothetical protein